MVRRPATAIVPYAATTPKIVQFATDGVAADVRVEPFDRQSQSNVYAIRLASSDAHLTGRLIGVLPSGGAVELGDVAVAPGSVGSARLAVAAPRSGYRKVYLEIRSERVLLQVEAPNPPPRRRVHPLAVAATALALGAVSLAGGAFALALPQTPVLRGPDRATAGAAVHVQYVTRGYGTGRYTARYDDGVVFASGPLPAPSGEITVELPSGAVNRRVSVAVATQGLLGGAAGFTSFSVVAPQVETKRLAVVPVHRYLPPAAPTSLDPGSSRAVASSTLPVQPPSPAPAPSVASVSSQTPGMLVFEGRAVAGAPLAGRVMPHRTSMTIAMQDANGETLAEQEVAPGTTRVTLPLPDRPGTYYVVLRYDGEDGAQTVVRTVQASSR